LEGAESIAFAAGLADTGLGSDSLLSNRQDDVEVSMKFYQRLFAVFGLCLLACACRIHAGPISGGAPDPYALNETSISVCSPASGLCNPAWRPSRDVSAKGLSLNGQGINTGVKNCVLISVAQSVRENIALSDYTFTNPNSVDDLSIYNDAIYKAIGPLTGSTNGSGPGIGNPLEPLGDALVTNGKCARVILMSAGIAGTSIIDWSTGTLSTRPAVIMNRLKQRGINCGTTNMVCVVILGDGETDSFNAMSTANFLSGLTTLVASFNSAGFVGYFLSSQETCCLNAGVPYTNIQTAQWATTPTGIINTGASNPICKGANVDALKGNNCNGSNACTQDGTHPTIDGIIAMATDATNGETVALHACAPSVF
jgi:hypothetical protein